MEHLSFSFKFLFCFENILDALACHCAEIKIVDENFM